MASEGEIMTTRPARHKKIVVKLNDEKTTDIVTLQIELTSNLTELVKDMHKEYGEGCDCDQCKSGTWDHFFVNLLVMALQESVELFIEEKMKNHFKGNTKVISNTVN